MKLVLSIALVLLVVSVYSDFIEIEDNLPEGFFEEDASTRVFGGIIARRGQFSYQAGIVANRNGAATWCSGAIISNTTILTTAHCAQSATFLDVSVGAQKIRNILELGRINIRVAGENSSNIIVHPGYNPDTAAFDIAIIRLPQAIVFNDLIKPADLPTFADVPNDISGTYVTLTGWGRLTNEDDNGISEDLRYATVRIQPDSVCEYFFGNLILPSNLCSETQYGSGTCRGDSGAPAVTFNKLVGLSSFVNSKGCESCLPNVLTRITYFLDWIEANSDVVIALA